MRTAMEGVEESYRRQKLEVKLINDYHVLKGVCDHIDHTQHISFTCIVLTFIRDSFLHPGVAYKSGQPPAMMVDKGSKNNWKDAMGKADSAPSVEEIKNALGGTTENSSNSKGAVNGNGGNKNSTKAATKAPVVPSPPASSKSQVKTGILEIQLIDYWARQVSVVGESGKSKQAILKFRLLVAGLGKSLEARQV